MTDLQLQLRKLRNKILYNDENARKKPVTLREVLLMFGKRLIAIDVENDGQHLSMFIDMQDGGSIELVYIDLSKPIERQDTIILEKIIKYIEN